MRVSRKPPSAWEQHSCWFEAMGGRVTGASVSPVSIDGHTIQLRNGTQVLVRPVRRDDRGRLLAFLRRLSRESRRLRFFSVACDLDRAAAWAAGADGIDEIGLIALAGNRIVAHAACSRLYGLRGEVAVEVDEEYRHLGLGSQLLRRLAQEAERKGIRHLIAEVLPDNHEMLAVFREEFAAEASHEHGEIDIQFPSAAWRAAPQRV